MCRPSCFDHWSELLALADANHGGGRLSRRRFLVGTAVSAFAAACSSAPPATAPAASSARTQDFLNDTFSFDIHSHPGLFQSTASNTSPGTGRTQRPRT